jgi:hypothetical protein
VRKTMCNVHEEMSDNNNGHECGSSVHQFDPCTVCPILSSFREASFEGYGFGAEFSESLIFIRLET